jgi:hypothetical protein
MHQTNLLPRLADAKSAPRSMPTPGDADIIRLPPRTEDVIDLFRRFQLEWDSIPPEELRKPSNPRFRVFDELSFPDLFRLNSLWHRVERPRAPDGHDANARHARRQETRWQNFYYDWAQPRLQERWAQRYGVVQAGGYLSYRRLFGKHARVGYPDRRREDDYPPRCDHTTLWRRKGSPPRFAEVFVTQPYWYRLEEMVAFARKKGLWFWISERPAWHYPLGVFFIEWANPKSQFASMRATEEADAWMRTIHTWKGDQILPGPGTVFSLLNADTIKQWIDGLDANSLTRAELTRLVQRHDEGSAH